MIEIRCGSAVFTFQKIQENSIRIVDVRRDQEYQQGHITNAVNLPLATLLNDDSPESIQKIAQDLGISNETPVVIYDDTFGALSSRVVWALQYIGHKDVKLLDVTFLDQSKSLLVLYHLLAMSLQVQQQKVKLV